MARKKKKKKNNKWLIIGLVVIILGLLGFGYYSGQKKPKGSGRPQAATLGCLLFLLHLIPSQLKGRQED